MILSSLFLVASLAIASADYSGPFCFSQYIRYGYYLPNKSAFKAGDIIKYYCVDKYKLIGEKILTCNGTHWNYPVPNCKHIKKCPRPYDIPYGYIEPHGVYEFDAKAEIWIKCHYGYIADGYAENVCQDNGRWQYSFPKCIPRYCRIPHLTPYLKVVNPKDYYDINEQIEYKCDNYYDLTGKTHSRCQKGGKWTVPPPKCGAACKPLGFPFNGYYIPRRTSYKPGESITYYCHGNLAVKGYKVLKCSQYGTWSHPPPTCDVPTCNPPKRPDQGTFHPQKSYYKIGDQVEFKCGLGFKLRGWRVLRCLPNGRWNYYIPKCVEPTCPKLFAPQGGFFGPVKPVYKKDDAVWFKCFPPYVLVGAKDIHCRPGGFWDPPPPKCKIPRCPPPPPIYYGGYQPVQHYYPIGITIKFHCDHYYALSGQATLTCKPGGHWSHDFPKCEHGCKRPQVPKFGYLFPFQEIYAINQPVWIKCLKGYRPNKSNDIVCKGYNIWEPTDHGVTCVTEGSCQHKCGKRDTGTLCRCDDDCHKEHQCCTDYVDYCFGNSYYH